MTIFALKQIINSVYYLKKLLKTQFATALLLSWYVFINIKVFFLQKIFCWKNNMHKNNIFIYHDVLKLSVFIDNEKINKIKNLQI